ncbi:sterol esterase [Mycena rebaudengoi]|nr:sterol esterase [Mycena rebaudengoi]
MLLTLLFPFLLSGHVTATSPKVSLQYAQFEGSNVGNLTKFLGIPFAQPVSRFELPKLPKRLHGVQNATAFGAACPQQAVSPGSPLKLANYSAISEDCLTLNLFKPSSANTKSKLPVFVWFYGEIFALQWVKRHIHEFGGDPNRVVMSAFHFITGMRTFLTSKKSGGMSAGAISVGMLLLSNRHHSNTLFHGALMLSGSPITSASVADGQGVYDQLVAANNCTGSSDSLDCLKRVPFDSFMATVNHTSDEFAYSSAQLTWRPRIDGDVVVQDPLISVSEKAFADIPIITGDADDEGTIFSLSNLNITNNAQFLEYIHSNYIPLSTPSQIQQLKTLYPEDPAQGAPFDTGSANQLSPEYKRLAAFQGDLIFVGPRRFLLEHASTRQNTWSYLSKRGKTRSPLGAFHSSDLEEWLPTTSKVTFGVNALVNFVNTLDPNRSAGPKNSSRLAVLWPKWKPESSSLLTFSDPDTVNITVENFRVYAMKYLNDLVLKEALVKKYTDGHHHG